MRKRAYGLFVLFFVLAQVAVAAMAARWYLDWRQAERSLGEQARGLASAREIPAETEAELERAREEAEARLREVTASLPELLKSADVVEQVYLAALSSGASLSRVSLGGVSGGSALRRDLAVEVSALVPDTGALLALVEALERGPLPAEVQLPSLQVLQGPSPVTLRVLFASRKGVDSP